MDRRRALILALGAIALVVVVALLSCGGDESTRAEGRHVNVRLDEYRITPSNITVDAGHVRITAVDDGVLTHNVRVESADQTGDDDKPIPFGGTDTAHPGETVTKVLDLPPGNYRLVCTIANHEDLGQYGTLHVKG